MLPSQSESATLPRGFRFHHYQDGERPTTPEPQPVQAAEQQPPSPPRASRLKLRRRNVSGFSAPTEHFLASVAAADIPIPTIEVPLLPEDEDMLDSGNTPHLASDLLSPRNIEGGETPRTPIPEFQSQEYGSHRPNWYMDSESTSEDIPTRPSSSMSNPSNWSDDSFYSGSHASRPSDDGSCTSPESDIPDPFRFALFRKGKGILTQNIDETISSAVTPTPFAFLNQQAWTKTRKNAKWSEDMSDHLWQTYQIYLQDPTVTPFRIGASSCPPEGVIHRVAREAKRSWKGPKTNHQQRTRSSQSATASVNVFIALSSSSSDTTSTSKSGSITPTDDLPRKGYVQWPHSSSATRNHLRDLCKMRDSKSVQTHRHLQSRSPTPFSQYRSRPKTSLPTPAHSRYSSFSTKDIALSLTTSCSDAMQPDGPLAQLAHTEDRSQPNTAETSGDAQITGLGISLDSKQASARLGSPFTPRTYGPSSSKGFGTFLRADEFNVSTGTGTTVPRLRSPVHFTHARSLNSTQKRRAQHSLDEDLTTTLRPSILGDSVFGQPSGSLHRRVRSRGFSLSDDLIKNRIPGLFEPLSRPLELGPMPESSTMGATSNSTSTTVTPSLLPAPIFELPPPSSSLTESGASNTFPRRLFQTTDGTSTMKRRPYATMHHARRSIDPFESGNDRDSSLQSRLEQIDQKLAEIRDRETANRSQDE